MGEKNSAILYSYGFIQIKTAGLQNKVSCVI